MTTTTQKNRDGEWHDEDCHHHDHHQHYHHCSWMMNENGGTRECKSFVLCIQDIYSIAPRIPPGRFNRQGKRLARKRWTKKRIEKREERRDKGEERRETKRHTTKLSYRSSEGRSSSRHFRTCQNYDGKTSRIMWNANIPTVISIRKSEETHWDTPRILENSDFIWDMHQQQ